MENGRLGPGLHAGFSGEMQPSFIVDAINLSLDVGWSSRGVDTLPQHDICTIPPNIDFCLRQQECIMEMYAGLQWLNIGLLDASMKAGTPEEFMHAL